MPRALAKAPRLPKWFMAACVFMGLSMSQLTANSKRDCSQTQYEEDYLVRVDLKDRIKEARANTLSVERPPLRMSQSELARRCGVDPSAINKLESGATGALSGELLVKMSRELNVEATWLAEGKGARRRADAPAPLVSPGEARQAIRRAHFRLSAGVSGYEIEYENGESEPIFMARRWFDQHHYRPESLVAVKVTGRSMEPSLYDGDLVVINTEDITPKDGVVFAANYEGELVIKRLRRDAGEWFLVSDSSDKRYYADKRCSDGCGLIGRIVYRQTEHI